MKKYLIILCSFLGFYTSQAQGNNHRFWSSSSMLVDYVRVPGTCSNIIFDDIEVALPDGDGPVRSTIVANGDFVRFNTTNSTENNFSWYWEIIRTTGPNAPDTTLESGEIAIHTFYKFSSETEELYENYNVKLYKRFFGGALQLEDEDQVYVTAERLGDNDTFEHHFDSSDIPSYAVQDDYGNLPVTSFPLFSGNGNTRSDKGKIHEKIHDQCLYPAYISNETLGINESEPRKGDGCLHVFNPKNAQDNVLLINLDNQICGENFQLDHYDFCLDSCAIIDSLVPAVDCDEYKKTLTAKAQLNIYPHHPVESAYFYGVSIKIPKDFDETDLIDPLDGAMGRDRWQILAEFHQSTWPHKDDEVPVLCQSALQLVYLGGGQVGLQYGLDDFNRCGFGPWKIRKGEWFDVVFHIVWGQVHPPKKDWQKENGLLEMWINIGEGYHKKCLTPATNFYRSKRQLGTKASNIGYFRASEDQTTLYGPNLENQNPPFLSLKSMRGAANGGTQGFDFETDVFFDELRIGNTLDLTILDGERALEVDGNNCYSGRKSLDKKPIDPDTNGWKCDVYPNPASLGSTFFSVEMVDKEDFPIRVKVHDIQGKEMFNGRILKDEIDVYCNTGSWSNGTYVVSFMNGDEIKLKKLSIIN